MDRYAFRDEPPRHGRADWLGQILPFDQVLQVTTARHTMKTLFSLPIALALATSVLAQGKVRVVNDSLHLVYWTTNPTYLLPQDYGLAGQAYQLGEAGVTFTIELWAGTAANSLSLVANTSFLGQFSPGTWFGQNVTLPFPGGTMDFFQILIYDQSAGSYENSFGSHYTGETPIFTAYPGPGIAYYFLTQHGFPSFSTWADGTFNLDSVSPGDRGAIELGIFVPEPSWSSFSGLACALWLMRSRIRK